MTNHQTMKHDAVCSAHGFFVLIFIPAGSEPSDSLQGFAWFWDFSFRRRDHGELCEKCAK